MILCLVTFDRNGDDTFRGFLALARDMSDTIVGSFTAGDGQEQTCSVSIVDEVHIVLVPILILPFISTYWTGLEWHNTL